MSTGNKSRHTSFQFFKGLDVAVSILSLIYSCTINRLYFFGFRSTVGLGLKLGNIYPGGGSSLFLRYVGIDLQADTESQHRR
jgi:hypothetical protein